MSKKLSWLWPAALLLIVATILIYRNINQKQTPPINRDLSVEQLDKVVRFNAFPLTATNEAYTLKCAVNDLIFYRNYYQSPQLAGGWRSLTDIECLYYDTKQNLQVIYLPLHLYQEETQTELLLYTEEKQQIPERIAYAMNYTNWQTYQNIFQPFFQVDFKPGYILVVDVSYPQTDLAANDTKGAAFDTLNQESAPYSQTDLTQFYQDGNPRVLPKINGHYYFWPLVSLGLINAANN